MKGIVLKQFENGGQIAGWMNLLENNSPEAVRNIFNLPCLDQMVDGWATVCQLVQNGYLDDAKLEEVLLDFLSNRWAEHLYQFEECLKIAEALDMQKIRCWAVDNLSFLWIKWFPEEQSQKWKLTVISVVSRAKNVAHAQNQLRQTEKDKPIFRWSPEMFRALFCDKGVWSEGTNQRLTDLQQEVLTDSKRFPALQRILRARYGVEGAKPFIARIASQIELARENV